MVHVTPGLNGVSRAVNEAERGLLPAEATIVAGQPCTVDESRAPAGKSVLWIQLQELPQRPAATRWASSTSATAPGARTLREAYADRIVARLGAQITNLASATVKRVVLSPADLEALNCNLVGGDIYAGSCSLDQNLLWRPTGACPVTRRRSTASGRSAPPRTPAPASAPARATSSPTSSLQAGRRPGAQLGRRSGTCRASSRDDRAQGGPARGAGGRPPQAGS